MKSIIAIILAGYLCSCSTDIQHRSFRGIYADDPSGTEGLYNPERGFRLEIALDVTKKNYVWEPEKYPDITSYLEEQSQIYTSDSVSLVQTYFYLTGAVGRKLTDEILRPCLFSLINYGSSGKKQYFVLLTKLNF